MNVQCTHCKSRNTVDDDAAGRIVDCSACGEPFRVWSPDDDQRACPNCGGAAEESTVVCLGCGFNFNTGEILNTTVTVEREELPSWHKTLNMVADTVPGVFKPMVLTAAIVCFCLGIGLGLLGLFLLGFGAGFAAIAIMAFGLICHAQSVALILCGSFQPLSRAMLEFESIHWYIFFALVLGPFVSLVAYFMYFAPTAQPH
jgi:hypothetical protein